VIDDVDKKNLKGGDIDKIVFDLAQKLIWFKLILWDSALLTELMHLQQF
jgi:hypothetical protein